MFSGKILLSANQRAEIASAGGASTAGEATETGFKPALAGVRIDFSITLCST
jgi:hypothetical protein